MKKTGLFFIISILMGMSMMAQSNDQELNDPKMGDQSCWANVKKPTIGWGSIDVRYSRSQVPTTLKAVNLYAWKGERVAAQALLWTSEELQRVSVTVSDLKSGKNTIPASLIKKYFVRYVMTNSHEGGMKDSMLVADRLDPAESLKVEAKTTRPIWLDIKVPQYAQAGKYKGTVTIEYDGKAQSLPLTLEVSDRTLPEPSEWDFHLDLWQNPYSVARHFNVPLWSDAHFAKMRPMMELLAKAGQKVITCSIIEHPWNCQTYDPFETMILKMKNIDGTWSYNYTVFDKWVEFMMSCGIKQQIGCYTLVPWGYRFEYLDVASGGMKHISCQPGQKEYEDYMLPFLTDFAKHLKAKGWFERTCISMDERPKDHLLAVLNIVKKADPNYRIEGAILNYFPEVAPKMYCISIPYGQPILENSLITARKNAAQEMTFYTCCGPAKPNTFTFSDPAESAWMGWHAASINYNGYLRWAYCSWIKNTNQDTRFGPWLSGDCYLVYPGGSSIRMERLTEGIQDFAKIQILKKELKQEDLSKLDETLKKFSITDFKVTAAPLINEGKALIRQLEKSKK